MKNQILDIQIKTFTKLWRMLLIYRSVLVAGFGVFLFLSLNSFDTFPRVKLIHTSVLILISAVFLQSGISFVTIYKKTNSQYLRFVQLFTFCEIFYTVFLCKKIFSFADAYSLKIVFGTSIAFCVLFFESNISTMYVINKLLKTKTTDQQITPPGSLETRSIEGFWISFFSRR